MLTKKEKQVLELRQKGFKQRDIAAKLKISQPAVSSFESNAVKKIRDAKKLLKYITAAGVKYDEE